MRVYSYLLSLKFILILWLFVLSSPLLAQPRVFYIPAGFPDQSEVELTNNPRAAEFCSENLRGLDIARGVIGLPTCEGMSGSRMASSGAPYEHLQLVLLVDDRNLSNRLANLLGPVIRVAEVGSQRFIFPYQGLVTQGSIRKEAIIVGELFSAGISEEDWVERMQSVSESRPIQKETVKRGEEAERKGGGESSTLCREPSLSIQSRYYQSCYEYGFEAPTSFEDLEIATMEWISRCISSQRPRNSRGEEPHREEELVLGNETLRSLWDTRLALLVGQSVKIFARYIWSDVPDRRGRCSRVERLDFRSDDFIRLEDRSRINDEVRRLEIEVLRAYRELFDLRTPYSGDDPLLTIQSLVGFRDTIFNYVRGQTGFEQRFIRYGEDTRTIVSYGIRKAQRLWNQLPADLRADLVQGANDTLIRIRRIVTNPTMRELFEVSRVELSVLNHIGLSLDIGLCGGIFASLNRGPLPDPMDAWRVQWMGNSREEICRTLLPRRNEAQRGSESEARWRIIYENYRPRTWWSNFGG